MCSGIRNAYLAVSVPLEHDAKDVVNLGEIAFWVEGACIATGFGPTPISQADEIRLAAATNIWADSNDDLRLLADTKAGDIITIKLL